MNIYIGTDNGSRKRLYRGYGAVVEFVRKNGKEETRRVSGLCDGTWDLAFILALTDALDLLTRPCMVRVYAPDRHVCGSICSGRVREWQDNGWLTRKGRPIANAEEWKELARAVSRHEICQAGSSSKYMTEIQRDIKEIKCRGEDWQQMRIMPDNGTDRCDNIHTGRERT